MLRHALETMMMSANRPAIVAGLFLSGLIANPCAAAHPSPGTAAALPLGHLDIAQANGDFFIRADATSPVEPRPSLQLGSRVRIDADLLNSPALPLKEIAR